MGAVSFTLCRCLCCGPFRQLLTAVDISRYQQQSAADISRYGYIYAIESRMLYVYAYGIYMYFKKKLKGISSRETRARSPRGGPTMAAPQCAPSPRRDDERAAKRARRGG